MEPAALAYSTVSFLTPYLIKTGEKTLEKAVNKLPEVIGDLLRTVTGRLKTEPGGKEATDDLLAKPDEKFYQSNFLDQLKKVLEAEPTFASELKQLLDTAQGGDTVINIGSGTVASGGSIAAGEGGIAVQGNVHGDIHVDRPQKLG